MDPQELSELVASKFNELKTKNSGWSTFRIKRELRTIFSLNKKELNDVDFFRLQKNQKQKNTIHHTLADSVCKKMVKSFHYDPQSIITKYLMAVGSVNNNRNGLHRSVVNILYKSHHKVSYD